MRASLALCALLLSPCLLPLASATGSAPVSATGPDAEGAYLLAYDVTLAAGATVALGLDVLRDDLGDVAHGTRDMGSRALPAGTTRIDASFVPYEGPGSYEVRLLVDGAPGDPLVFEVTDGAGATAEVTFAVPDEPTQLNLTGDSVNADGKLKSPGEELITRAMMYDGNGVTDVTPGYRVTRLAGGAAVGDGPLAYTAAANATQAFLELRYARTPIAAGDYRMTFVATKSGIDVANASRTFAIRDVAALLQNATLPPVVADSWRNVTADLVMLDKNGVDPTHALEARVYRGSTRVESQGFAASFGAYSPLPDADGYGRATLPLHLTVPARAAPGAYRVSVYENGTLAGSAPFDVRPLPTLLAVATRIESDTLHLDVQASGEGLVRATLSDGASASATLVAGNATVALVATTTGELRWELALHATTDGPAVDARNGTWTRAPPFGVSVVPIRPPPRFPALYEVAAGEADLNGSTASVVVTRWDGATEPALVATYDAASRQLRLDAPPTLEAGLYTARLTLLLANGTTAETGWSFEAGPWLRVALGAPIVAGREARLSLANEGGLSIRRLVVEAEGARSASLEVGGSAVAASGSTGARTTYAVDIAPGGSATVLVRLGDGPLAAGPHAARVRVYALAGA